MNPKIVKNFAKPKIIKRTNLVARKQQNVKTFTHSTAPTSVVAEKRVINDDIKLSQRPLNASQSGWEIDMSTIRK